MQNNIRRTLQKCAKTMKAIVVHQFGDASKLKYEPNWPKPEIATAEEVLIKVCAVGVNPVDTYIRTGTYVRVPQLPYIPGGDAAGIVEQVGTDVPNCKPGDRVFCTAAVSGTYAEYARVDFHHVCALPDRLTFKEGAAIGVPYFTAYRALVTKGQLNAGESALIHGGSGGVGVAAVQIAKHLGANVFATAGSDAGIELVKSAGAMHAFNHRQPGYTDDIMKTAKDGINLIVEMLANVNLDTDLRLLSHKGRVLIVGNRGRVEIDPRQTMAKESSITGVAMPNNTKDEWLTAGRFLSAGAVAGWLTPIVNKTYTLEQAYQAHVDVIEQSGGARGKLVLMIE